MTTRPKKIAAKVHAPAPPSFPLFLDDPALVARWGPLIDREQACRVQHEAVLRFLLPEQRRLAEDFRVWWDAVYAHYAIPRETRLELRGRTIFLVPDDKCESKP